MPKLPITRRAESDSSERDAVAFQAALRTLAARVGAKGLDAVVTPISVFRSSYTAVLDRVRNGSIEVITHRGEAFVLLGRSQLSSLMRETESRRTAAELLDGLPSVPSDGHIPRVRSILSKSHHRVPPQTDR